MCVETLKLEEASAMVVSQPMKWGCYAYHESKPVCLKWILQLECQKGHEFSR